MLVLYNDSQRHGPVIESLARTSRYYRSRCKMSLYFPLLRSLLLITVTFLASECVPEGLFVRGRISKPLISARRLSLETWSLTSRYSVFLAKLSCTYLDIEIHQIILRRTVAFVLFMGFFPGALSHLWGLGSLLQASGEPVPLVVDSCIRFINLHGNQSLMNVQCCAKVQEEQQIIFCKMWIVFKW